MAHYSPNNFSGYASRWKSPNSQSKPILPKIRSFKSFDRKLNLQGTYSINSKDQIVKEETFSNHVVVTKKPDKAFHVINTIDHLEDLWSTLRQTGLTRQEQHYLTVQKCPGLSPRPDSKTSSRSSVGSLRLRQNRMYHALKVKTKIDGFIINNTEEAMLKQSLEPPSAKHTSKGVINLNLPVLPGKPGKSGRLSGSLRASQHFNKNISPSLSVSALGRNVETAERSI